ncbi:equilibrative nucleobase transporter 1-like isoform X2 [Pleurodeles waltl]|uniref:equilibrative nucleobase transporter 1-like isoform X2 n=1 Tax=Pleurodeles waltl TaxID=8319 RepID=UPI003709B9C1
MVVAAGLAKRLATFFTGLLECMGFAGVVFGWASLVFILKQEKYFANLCTTDNSTSSNSTGETDCSAQDERFSLIFTIASFLNNFMTLPCGFIFDRFGTMVTRLISISLYTVATLLVAFSTAASAWLLFPALSLLAIGGILFIMTNMQVGNLFGRHRSTIITLYNGAFDSSSAVFLLIKVLYEQGLTLMTMFICISACSIWHLVRTFFLMPRTHIPYPVPEDYSYGITCQKSASYSLSMANPDSQDGVRHRSVEEAEKGPKSLLDRVAPEPPVASFRSCACSWLFTWHLLWLSVMQLRHYLFIGTLNPMLAHLSRGDQHKISVYTNAFAFTQLCGVLCAPWNGILMDRHKRGKKNEGGTEALKTLADLRSAVLSLALTAGQCVLFSICASVPVLPVQYATFILQVVNRSFLYGGNAAFIAMAFPLAHFGKLYGLVMALSAIVSILQYPCFALVKDVLDGDPFYVNISLIIFVLLAFIHPINVFLECRRRERAAGGAADKPPAVMEGERTHLEGDTSAN